jgi:hypothetical protein
MMMRTMMRGGRGALAIAPGLVMAAMACRHGERRPVSHDGARLASPDREPG